MGIKTKRIFVALMVLFLSCSMFGSIVTVNAAVTIPFTESFINLTNWKDVGGSAPATSAAIVGGRLFLNGTPSSIELANTVSLGYNYFFGFKVYAENSSESNPIDFTVNLKDSTGDNQFSTRFFSEVYDQYNYGWVYSQLSVNGGGEAQNVDDGRSVFQNDGPIFFTDPYEIMYHVQIIGNITKFDRFVNGVFDAVYFYRNFVGSPMTVQIDCNRVNNASVYIDDLYLTTSTVGVPADVQNEIEGNFDYYVPIWTQSIVLPSNFTNMGDVQSMFAYENQGVLAILTSDNDAWIANLTTGEFIQKFYVIQPFWTPNQASSVFNSYYVFGDFGDNHDIVTILKNGEILQLIDATETQSLYFDYFAMSADGKYFLAVAHDSAMVMYEGRESTSPTPTDEPTPAPSGPTPTSTTNRLPTTTVDYYFHQHTIETVDTYGYAMLTNPPYTSKSVNGSESGEYFVTWGARLFVKYASGTTSELTDGTPVELGTLIIDGPELLSATFDIGQLQLTFGESALYAQIYYRFNTGAWQTAGSFITEPLYYTKVVACEVTFQVYAERDTIDGTTYAITRWGTPTYQSGLFNIQFRTATNTDWQSYYLGQGNFVMFLAAPYVVVLGNFFYAIILFAVGMTVYARYRNLSMVVLLVVLLTAGGGSINLIAGNAFVGIAWLICAFGLALVYWRIFR